MLCSHVNIANLSLLSCHACAACHCTWHPIVPMTIRFFPSPSSEVQNSPLLLLLTGSCERVNKLGCIRILRFVKSARVRVHSEYAFAKLIVTNKSANANGHSSQSQPARGDSRTFDGSTAELNSMNRILSWPTTELNSAVGL